MTDTRQTDRQTPHDGIALRGESCKHRSQIAHSDMHHPVSGINSLIHFDSLASHVSTHLLIHLSAHLYYHHHSRHPSLLHSFTPSSKPAFSTNPSHLRLLLPTGLPLWQRDWTGPIMLTVLFLVSHFNFSFVPCGGLSWLYPSAFYCTLNTQRFTASSFWGWCTVSTTSHNTVRSVVSR